MPYGVIPWLNSYSMRILKISDVYFPRVNGVSTSIRTFARELLRQGHEVTLLAPEYKSQHADTEFDIVRIPSRYLPIDPEDRFMKPTAIKKQIAWLKQQQFDVLHIHTPFVAHYQGIKLAHKLDLPIVETYHTYFEEYGDKYLPWVSRKVLRFIARHLSRNHFNRVDRMIVPTRPMLDVLRDYGIQSPVEIIPTGIPQDAFVNGDAAAFRQRFGIEADRPVMLYVGRVAHEKNIDFLLNVTHQVRRQVPDILFVVVGDGPAMKMLQKQVTKQDLSHNVRFVGYLSHEHDLPDCYAAADIFVFASSTETQGLVLLEAMQAGTPVVSTAVVGTAEIMRDKRGGLVAQEDVDSFSQAVVRILRDTQLRQKCSLEGVQKAAEWSVAATTQRLADVYADMVIKTRTHNPPDANAHHASG